VNDNHALVHSILRSDRQAVHERDPRDGITPLMLACLKGDIDVIQLLLPHSVGHINAKNDSGWTGTRLILHNIIHNMNNYQILNPSPLRALAMNISRYLP
jgi:ankyrin repeat protein